MKFKMKFNKSVFVTILSLLAIVSLASANNVERIPTSSRVENLIQNMTLEEKISVLGGTGFATRPVERLKIPALEMSDGPVGVRFGQDSTAWPAAIGLAATFNPDLLGEMARNLGEEARAQNKRLLLGPTVNITRTPWGGRVFESYGEDPFLTSELTQAYITGVQSQGVGTSLKHFAVNNQEWGRGHVDVHVSERALREIYWPAFVSGVNAGTVSVMAAYNKINGAYCSENSHLLQDVLKRDWGFQGFVLSDWGATHSTINAALNGLDLEMPSSVFFGWNLFDAVKKAQVPLTAIEDKLRRILTGMEHLGLLDETQRGPATKNFEKRHPATALKMAQESLVLLKNEGGLLPIPNRKRVSVAVMGPSATRARTGGGGSSMVHYPAETISAVQGLERRIKEDSLPIDLDVDDSMTLPGDGVRDSAILGSNFHAEFFNNPELNGEAVMTQEPEKIDFDWEWEPPSKSMGFDTNYSVRFTNTLTPRESGDHEFRLAYTQAARIYLDERLIYDHWVVDADQSPLINETTRIRLEKGQTYSLRVEYFKKEGLASIQLEILEPSQLIENMIARTLEDAKSMAAQSDYVVLFVGQSAKTESESFDRTTMRLTRDQEAVILKSAQVNPNTIVVVQAGSPIDMTAWAPKVRAILYAWYPGEQGGLAIADALLGRINPSGRLPISFPKTWTDSGVASSYPGENGIATYTEDVFVGYRFFDGSPKQASYRFGHGLSYTTFANSLISTKINSAHVDSPSIDVVSRVTNTGSRGGAYVVQLYVGESQPLVPRPLRELKGLKKVYLEPGQSTDVTIHLDAQAFRHFDDVRNVWVTTPGDYEISILGEDTRLADHTVVRLESPDLKRFELKNR
jgi:beta-glucosidase